MINTNTTSNDQVNKDQINTKESKVNEEPKPKTIDNESEMKTRRCHNGNTILYSRMIHKQQNDIYGRISTLMAEWHDSP